MNNLDKYFSKFTDKEFEALLYCLSHEEPVWEQITQEEYERYIESEDIKKLMFNGDSYKVEPVFTESGLFAQLTAKPVGYKYYKRTGSKRVITVGGRMADAIIKRMNQTKEK